MESTRRPVVAVFAVRLDHESRTLGFELVPMDRWLRRTRDEAGDLAALSG